MTYAIGAILIAVAIQAAALVALLIRDTRRARTPAGRGLAGGRPPSLLSAPGVGNDPNLFTA